MKKGYFYSFLFPIMENKIINLDITDNKIKSFELSGLGMAIYYRAEKCVKFFLANLSIKDHLLNISSNTTNATKFVWDANKNNLDVLFDGITQNMTWPTIFFIEMPLIISQRKTFLNNVHNKCKIIHNTETSNSLKYCFF